MSEEKLPEMEVVAVDKNQNDMALLKQAAQGTVFALLEYYNKNKNYISKNDLFKVMVAAALYPMEIEFPEAAKYMLFDPEHSSPEQKNFMAFMTHLFDINQNVRLRGIVAEVAQTTIEEEKK